MKYFIISLYLVVVLSITVSSKGESNNAGFVTYISDFNSTVENAKPVMSLLW